MSISSASVRSKRTSAPSSADDERARVTNKRFQALLSLSLSSGTFKVRLFSHHFPLRSKLAVLFATALSGSLFISCPPLVSIYLDRLPILARPIAGCARSGLSDCKVACRRWWRHLLVNIPRYTQRKQQRHTPKTIWQANIYQLMEWGQRGPV